jgi:hypothetical protein
MMVTLKARRMSYFVFLLSLLLLAAGLAGVYFSLDLLPTSMGVLYALAGAGAVGMAILTLAVGVLIRRVDRLAALVRHAQPTITHPAPLPTQASPIESELAEAPLPEGGEPAIARIDVGGEPPNAELAHAGDDEPINENRTGHLPTLSEIENAIETPLALPTLIGRYSSGGANYMIFSDGSIEADTEEGAYKFDSMGDFKKYLAERRGAKS